MVSSAVQYTYSANGIIIKRVLSTYLLKGAAFPAYLSLLSPTTKDKNICTALHRMKCTELLEHSTE